MAYYESKMYTGNTSREMVLEDMKNALALSIMNDLIKSSKVFLGVMKVTIAQQSYYINKFAVQPDPDEQNELKIGTHNNI